MTKIQAARTVTAAPDFAEYEANLQKFDLVHPALKFAVAGARDRRPAIPKDEAKAYLDAAIDNGSNARALAFELNATKVGVVVGDPTGRCSYMTVVAIEVQPKKRYADPTFAFFNAAGKPLTIGARAVPEMTVSQFDSGGI